MGKDARRGEDRPMTLEYGFIEVAFLSFLGLVIASSLIFLCWTIYKWRKDMNGKE